MVWPYDAVPTVYAPLMPVESDDLNELLERVVDVHRERKITLVLAMDNTGTNQWTWMGTAWVAVSAATITFPIQVPTGWRLKNARVKCQSNGAVGFVLGLYAYSAKFDSAGTAPAVEAALDSDVLVTSGWAILDLTPAATELATNDRIFLVTVAAGQAGDIVAGIRVTFEPITPTP